MMRRLLCALGVLVWSSVSYAEAALLQQKQVQVFMNSMVKEHGFNRAQLAATLREAQFQPQIIDSMERPYEKKTWDVYQALFLTPQRLQAGLEFWQANQQTLKKAEQKFNVPAPIIVAIIGVETLYGKNQGNYRVLDALTTLAFHYPKRSAFFTKELKEYLLLCREHKVAATEYKGSYAGAMGKPQFMPSSYRFYAVDATGKGHSNLMHNDEDVINSVANYFHKHGWKMNETVVQAANVRGAQPKHVAVNTRHADYEYQRLLRAGVAPVGYAPHHPAKAGLIELNTDSGHAYWLAYPNFYVITRYNTSPQYALVVYLLSQQLAGRWAALAEKNTRA